MSETNVNVASNGTSCIRFGGTSGVQLSMGEVSDSRSSTVALNDLSTLYCGLLKDEKYSGTANDFAETFSEIPTVITSFNTYKYWFGDAIGSTSCVDRVDFFTNKSTSKEEISFNYLAMGAFSGSASSLGSANVYLDSDNTICIGGSSGIKLCHGSFSLSGCELTTQVNSKKSVYSGAIDPGVSFDTTHPFKAAPLVFAVPSVPCKTGSDEDTISFPYWFGKSIATTSGITSVRVYTDTSHSSQNVYGRYIAVGTY